MSQVYAILDAQGGCIGHCLWDGVTPWQPPDGCTVAPDPNRVHTPPAEPQVAQPDWLGFSEALLTNPAFQKVRGAAAQDVAVMAAYSDLGWQLNRASAGIVNPGAIAACFGNLFAVLTGDFVLTVEERQGLAALMAVHNLDTAILP